MDPASIRDDTRRTSTENLLDRVTIYRGETESAAIGIIESELRQRGISGAEVVWDTLRRFCRGMNNPG
jgi:hypothetical protein